jgi:hypothetical protein
MAVLAVIDDEPSVHRHMESTDPRIFLAYWLERDGRVNR